VKHGAQLIGVILFGVDCDKSEVLGIFHANGTSATTTADHANRNSVCTFILDNDSGEVAIENLTFFFIKWRVDYCRIDKSVLFFGYHGNRYARDSK